MPPLSLIRLRPRDHQTVTRAAEVRGDLLRPLERRIQRMRPGDRVVVVGHGSAKLVLNGQEVVEAFRDGIGDKANLVREALQRTFGARTVIPLDEDNQRVVQLRPSAR